MKSTAPLFPSSPTSSPMLVARQALFRLASVAFSDPRVGAWHVLRDPATADLAARAAELLRAAASARAPDLAPGERPHDAIDPGAFLSRLPASPEGLEREYEQTFGLLVSSSAPPYEMEYIDAKETFQRSNTLADLSGFYTAFGLRPSAAFPERPDHITLELEFVAALLRLEREAEKNADPSDGAHPTEICRDARRRFLAEHLAWWAPAFVRLLEMHAPDGFYAGAGHLVTALIPAERALLGLPAVERGIALFSRETAPDACNGCDLNG